MALRSPESVSSQSFRRHSSASVRRLTLTFMSAAVRWSVVQMAMSRALSACRKRPSIVWLS